MASVPEMDSSPEQEPAASRWLGSVARRGDAEAHGEGWTGNEGEGAEQPRWLGSVARREGSHSSGAGWVEPEQTERPRWVGSVARRGERQQPTENAEPGGEGSRSLYLVDLEPTSEDSGEENEGQSTGSWQGSRGRARLNAVRVTVPEHPELFEPGDELGKRRTRVVAGALGMSLRVVA